MKSLDSEVALYTIDSFSVKETKIKVEIHNLDDLGLKSKKFIRRINLNLVFLEGTIVRLGTYPFEV